MKMAGSKTIDRICCLAVAVMLILTTVIWVGKAGAGKQRTLEAGYEGLFDTGFVHTIDIEIADWDSVIAAATEETYTECSVTIDGEKMVGVGIRAKGNTSLSSVASMGSEKYSFKIEFDQFVKGKTYHGLDKLSLNNLIYDATMMKDYLAYTMMNRAGVPAPLCSYVQMTVNGEPWGLYLAVEGVEESFMERNNMTTGELYKPDSMSFGGGRGNGRDFDFEQFRVKEDESEESSDTSSDSDVQSDETASTFSMPPGDFSGQPPFGMTPPDGTTFPGGFQPPQGSDMPDGFQLPEDGNMPGDFQASDSLNKDDSSAAQDGNVGFRFGSGMFNFGMGSSDVKLQYIDDDPESYANIFNNAKTKVGKKDKARLIETLKTLNGENAQDAVFTDEVIRYLAVHNFLQNDDSYTGMMVHNYYLYEENGKLAIIPWDYNLAFGGMGSSSDASSTINSPIDTPVSNSTGSDRPLISWIFQDEAAMAEYHAFYSQFIADTVESGWLDQEIARVEEMIRPFVQSDANSFYTAEEFDTAVAALRSYCVLRGQSVRGQLDGTIPSTSEGQRKDQSALVDTGHLNLSDMGVMNTGGGGPGGNEPLPLPGAGRPSSGNTEAPSFPASFQKPDMNSMEEKEGAEVQQEDQSTSEVLPDFTNAQRPEGMRDMPESGFAGKMPKDSASQRNAWITFSVCLAFLMLAVLAVSRVRSHNG